jgi:hypothetical protein
MLRTVVCSRLSPGEQKLAATGGCLNVGGLGVPWPSVPSSLLGRRHCSSLVFAELNV